MSSLLSSLASFLKGEKRVSSSESEAAVSQVLLSDTVANATKRPVITPEGSLAISAVWACIRILSETVLYACIGILVLAVLLCVFAVLDGKFRTAVQTAKAQGAAVFYPDGLLVP